jgi:DNA-binding transcriptional LysR family regulator
MTQNPLTLDALRVIDSIARRGSFAAAAAELNRVTSAISYTVQKLEEELGVALFDRSGHRARLTEAGELLAARAGELLTATQQLTDDVRSSGRGWEQVLTIAIDAVYPEQTLLPLVRRFYEHLAAQGANTDLRLITEVLGGPWDALESGRADIAIAPEGLANAAGFRSRPLGSVEFVYVAAPSHPVFDESFADEGWRERHRAIVVADTSRAREPRSVRLGKRQPTLTVSSFTAKLALLEAGLGVGSMPRHLVEEAVTRGRLRLLPSVADDHAAMTMVVAWRPRTGGKARQWLLRHLPEVFGN